MANRKKKNKPSYQSSTVFTLGRSMEERAPAAPVAVRKRKAPLSSEKRRQKWIILLAALALAGIGVGIFFGFFYEGKFSYIKSELSDYISVKESDYKNLIFDMPLAEFDDDDVERAIASYLVENKGKELYDGLGIKELPIALGSEVYYFYRMYTIGENGAEVDIPDHSNYSSEAVQTLIIGDYSNLDGIDAALMGKKPVDLTPFEKITSGRVEEGDIVYLSYSAYSPSVNKTVTGERVDLDAPGLEDTYGEGFIEYIRGLRIGETDAVVNFDVKDGTIAYSNMKVDFVTRCEDGAITIETTFSPTYSDNSATEIDETTLRGTKAYVDIFVKYHVMYELPEYNDKFITETLGISEEELNKHEGKDLKEKHAAYTAELIKNNVADINKRLIQEKLLSHFAKIGEVIKYPESEVESLYNSYYASLWSYYQQNLDKYETVDDCAIAVYGLSAGADWQQYLTKIAQKEIKENLVFFYVANAMGYLPPTDEEYEDTYNRIMDYELGLLIEEHKDELEGLDGEEYDKHVAELKEQIIEVVGKDALKLVVYREIATARMVEELVTVPQRK